MKNRKKFVSILALIMAVVLILSLILSLIPTASAASSSEIKKQINELKSQAEDIEDQMDELQAQYDENEDEIIALVDKKNLIDQEISLLYAKIDVINEQISAYNLLIADKQDELDEAQANLDELNEQYKERIRTMEEEGEISYWSVLFNANSLSDLLDRLNMIEEIAASDQRRLKELDAAAQVVEEAQQTLESEKEELQTTMDELDAASQELEEKQEEYQELLSELVERAAELEALQEEYDAQKQELLDEIAVKEQEYNEAKLDEWLAYMATYTTVAPATTATTSTSGSDSSSSGSSSSGSSSSSSTTWLIPCNYIKVSSPFGYRDAPTAGASTYHKGVDLAAPAGTPIYASRTGVVTTATYSSSAGNYVVINHGDGYSSIYMHMTNYVVSVGQAVSAGQVIGYVGSTGISTGNHLHFGITYNGTYVNPALYVNLY